jgi:hypothetical protein
VKAGATASKRSTSKAASSASRTKAKAKSRTRGRQASTNGSGSNAATAARERAGEAVAPALDGVRHTASDVAKHAAASIATGTIGAAAGIAGGILIGRTVGTRQRKILGLTVPGQKNGHGLSQVASGISEAGKQFGKLAGEVRAAREKAEEIGKALS